jgi:hypothetical protein
MIAARCGGSPGLTFECEPMLTYIFVPARLKRTPRVEWPPSGSVARCCGRAVVDVCPAAYGSRTTASVLPT